MQTASRRSHQDQIQRWSKKKSKPVVSWTWWISYSHVLQLDATACCFAAVVVVVVVVVADEMVGTLGLGLGLGLLVVRGEE